MSRVPGRSLGLLLDNADRDVLLVDCLQHFTPASYRWLDERLALAQLQEDLRLLELLLVLLQRLVNVFAIF